MQFPSLSLVSVAVVPQVVVVDRSLAAVVDVGAGRSVVAEPQSPT